MSNMKSLLGAFILITTTFAFGNDRCNKLHIKETDIDSSSTSITAFDILRAWNGQPIGQLYKIKGHEYIIVRSAGAVQIIHAESCPCKNKSTIHLTR